MVPGPDVPLDEMAMALRIGAALAAGAVLGINRELHRKPAGLRTHSLVSIGSALVVMAALILARGDANSVSRVMQGLVAGIGFLGAGVIIHHEAQRRVEGLTTAASVWVAAGLGMACGAGFFTLALIALLAAMAVLVFGAPIERELDRRFIKQKDETDER
jgi:putative Mg2+ transporter-C (MgtC) family protein